MTAKKKSKNVMSFSCKPDMQEEIKAGAKKMGYPSYSEMLRTLVSKHLDLLVHDGEYVPIKLKIPAELKGNPEGLRDWLDKRVNTIVDKLSL